MLNKTNLIALAVLVLYTTLLIFLISQIFINLINKDMFYVVISALTLHFAIYIFRYGISNRLSRMLM